MTDRATPSRRWLGWILVPLLVVTAISAWFVLDPGFRTTPETASAGGSMPKDAFEQRVRAYLLENPEVLVEAMQRLEARRRATEQSEAAAVLKERAEDVFHDPASPVGGNPDGDVTLVEFFDYNCPYCRRVAPVMIDAEAADSELRIVYKEFPILGPDSLYAAKAALAADRQGRYAAFHKALMQVEGPADQERVLAIAAGVGLNVERLEADIQDPGIQEAIDRNLALARDLRITGTPGFVVGEQILRGATDLETLQTHIREARTQ